ncbi:uncharacterized protein BDV17DRAFT_112799 [Aspergillus undulatus]|uniref:uncharacterized protein n=1 Tax=Aspergillus undulatus TaxID=1810928 RepID=UPI003CCDF5E9
MQIRTWGPPSRSRGYTFGCYAHDSRSPRIDKCLYPRRHGLYHHVVCEPLEVYWDRVSEVQQEKVIQQLRDYVHKMRVIRGDFIGGLDSSPCVDGIFEGGFGNYRDYSYGPYKSEADFNEGTVQALRNRLSKRTLEREKEDPESRFWASEYHLHRLVRSLKRHEIVFTHGDFHPRNMAVRSDGTVVVLDWGVSEFWPEYWEFYRALFSYS